MIPPAFSPVESREPAPPGAPASGRPHDESELLKSAIVESALDAIVAIDHSGSIIQFNPAAERTFGRKRSDVLGQDMAQLLMPSAYRDDHRRGFARYLATGEGRITNRRLEMSALRADGTEFPIELTVCRLAYADPPVFVAFIRDISDSVRAKEELRQSVERFELIGRATNDAVWDWDLVKKTVWWNDSYRTLFGYADEEIEPGLESWTNYIHPSDLGPIKTSIEAAIDGGAQYWEGEYRFRRRDGTWAYVYDRGHVIRDASGRAIRMIGAMMDISARKVAEERFHQLAEHIGEVFWLTDVAKRQILYISPAYETIWGRSAASIYLNSASWREAIHPEDKERVLASETLQAQGTYDEEYRIIRPDGSVRWIHDRAFPIRDESGEVYRIAGVAEDVTDRRRLEEQLRQAQKMEAIGQLSGGLAHDFNNLLTVIQGNASLLSDLLATPEAAEHVQEIVHAVERGASLTRQLLMFSRKQVMQPAAIDLTDVVANTTRMLRRLLGDDVVLRAELAPALPLIHADAGMIEQVLLNLAVNARDAMPDGGELVIATGSRTIQHGAQANPDATPGVRVCLTVRDTGVGIPPDRLARIFEPFFTTKEPGKGSGLGLATVYGIVKQHRGWIEVNSALGVGSAFSIYLPAVEGVRDRDAAGQPASKRARGGTEGILVVEDEPAVRALAANLLRRYGYTVYQAASGVEALDVWAMHRDRIDLLLTDLVMPDGINGRVLASRLLEDKPSLKVIYSSGYSADIIDTTEKLVEGVSFLPKPYRPEELADAIRRRLDSRR